MGSPAAAQSAAAAGAAAVPATAPAAAPAAAAEPRREAEPDAKRRRLLGKAADAQGPTQVGNASVDVRIPALVNVAHVRPGDELRVYRAPRAKAEGPPPRPKKAPRNILYDFAAAGR